MTSAAVDLLHECPREPDVLETIAFGRWSEADGTELRQHIANCRVCQDVAEVARALHDDRAALMRDAHPPTAAIVWWRSTVRARAEATRTAMQPITLLQGVAGACVAGATAALATIGWRLVGPGERIGALLSQFAIDHASAPSGVSFDHAAILLAGLAACLVLAPVALYLTLGDD